MHNHWQNPGEILNGGISSNKLLFNDSLPHLLYSYLRKHLRTPCIVIYCNNCLNKRDPVVINPSHRDLNLKPINYKLGYKPGWTQGFHSCLYPWKRIVWSHVQVICSKDSTCIICHQDGQSVIQEQSCSGLAEGLQFTNWVSVKDIWVCRPLPSVQSRRLTEEINEAQLCKIGVKHVQLWLPIYQRALLAFPLDSIHYQNGLQKLFIKNKLMLINSNCSDH